MRELIRFLVLPVICSFLVACNDLPVVQDVGQKEAIEIVALLSSNGISALASKDTSGKGRYRVEVSKRNYDRSLTLLQQNRLPREDSAPTMNELVGQQGLIPNSREIESLRLDLALALELQELLLAHPGVVSAKVTVRLNFLGQGGNPAVSAVVQTASGSTLTPETVTALVVPSVPGVARENIKIALEPAPAGTAPAAGEGQGVYNDGKNAVAVPLATFLWWRVADSDTFSITLIASVSLFVMLAAGALLGYWYGFFKQGQQVVESELPELGPKSLRIDRGKRELLLNK